MIKATVDYVDGDSSKKKPEILSKKPIHCIECNRLLAEIIFLQEDEKMEETKYQLVCPCGGESYSIITHIICRFLFAENLTVMDVKTINNKTVQYLKEYNA
jgi:hypothetical protein